MVASLYRLTTSHGWCGAVTVVGGIIQRQGTAPVFQRWVGWRYLSLLAHLSRNGEYVQSDLVLHEEAHHD